MERHVHHASVVTLPGRASPSVCPAQPPLRPTSAVRILQDPGDFGAQNDHDTARKDGDYLHILVHPSDVVLLLQDPAHHLPDGVSAVLHAPTTCLRLVLRKPVSIAAPSDISRLQKGRDYFRLLGSLRMLAEQTVLTIRFGQRHVPDPGAIQQLCQAFCSGSVKQHPRHNTLQDFYPGRGATVIEDFGNFAGFETTTPALECNKPDDDGQNTKSPPPYAEAQPTPQPAPLPVPQAPGAGPPPSLFAQPPRKRQRASTITSTTAPPDTRNFYSEFLAQQKAQTEAFLSQQAQMGKMLAHLGNQVEQMPDRLIKSVNECLGEEGGTGQVGECNQNHRPTGSGHCCRDEPRRPQ